MGLIVADKLLEVDMNIKGKFGADDEDARTIMEHELIVRSHTCSLVPCETKEDVERYVYECGLMPGYVTVDMHDAAWLSALHRTYNGREGQHILDGVIGTH